MSKRAREQPTDEQAAEPSRPQPRWVQGWIPIMFSVAFRDNDDVPQAGRWSAEGAKWGALALKQVGVPSKVVAEIFGGDRSTHERNASAWEKDGWMTRRPGQGPKRKISDDMAKAAKRQMIDHPTAHSIHLVANEQIAHARTWQRAMNRVDMSYQRKKKPKGKKIQEHTKKKRVAFSRKILHQFGGKKAAKRTLSRKVSFSDSKIFSPDVNGITHCWAPTGAPRRLGGKKKVIKVHVYGAICRHGGSRLVLVSGTTGLKLGFKTKTGKPAKGVAGAEYQKHVLPALLSDMKQLFAMNGQETWIWQQDHAPAHSTRDGDLGDNCRATIHKYTKEVWYDFPKYSPDLSPIENVWAIMQYRLDLMNKEWKTVEAYITDLQKVWEQVTGDADLMAALLDSVPDRLSECIEREGAETDY